MPLNIYEARDQRVRIAVLTAIVSPDDLVAALVSPCGADPAERCLVSFASAGVFALSHDALTRAMRRVQPDDLPKKAVLFAPSQVSYGVARMLQSSAGGLGQTGGMRLEREEGQALAMAGLPPSCLQTLVAQTRRKT